jgi:DNA-binding NtrC family response regulator
MASNRVLVIDDEQSICDMLQVVLKKEGIEARTSTDPVAGLDIYKQFRPDVVIHDLKMPSMDGIELLGSIKKHDPDALVVVMTAYGTWEKAVEAMRLGAYNYVEKPFDNRDIKAVIHRALQLRAMQGERNIAEAIPALGGMVGSSEPIRHVMEVVRRVAPTDSTVLIQGESGTGKELVARALHYGSPRSAKPIITVNCGAFTETLLESELFGHMKGAFTGAVATKTGLLEVADKGTFFLDEIGEMSLQLQVKLLRVLEEHEYKPVGSTKTHRCDVRFIAATNRDLAEEVKKGTFREDLYYRLNVIALRIPPLRERKEDVPLLAGHFLARFAERIGRRIDGFSQQAIEWLVSYDWPGNIRDLENTIQRAVTMSDGEIIEVADLVDDFHESRYAQNVESASAARSEAGIVVPASGVNLEDELQKVEIEYIRQALRQANGHLTNTAKLLGISFRSLRYKIEKYGLDVDELTN